MPDAVVQSETVSTREVRRGGRTDGDEVVAFCPECKAFETLWFTGDVLVQTRKFTQDGARVYHDCGSEEPCRLLLRFHDKR